MNLIKVLCISALLVLAIPLAVGAAPVGTFSSDLNPAGQTFWGDGAVYGGGYLTAPAQNWSGSGVCLECHGGLNEPFPPFSPIPNKSSYLKTGHGNMLEKVTAGQPFKGPLGVPYPKDSVGQALNFTNATIDLGGRCAGFTGEGQFDAAGCIAGGGTWTPGTRIVNLIGLIGPWMTIDAPDALITGTAGDGDLGNVLWMDSGRKYGTCASCHTAGYKASDYTRLNPWATWPATAAGSASGVGGSWVLNGIQCERCHDASGHHTAPGYVATVYSGAASTDLCSQCHIRNAGWEGSANPSASTAPAAWPIPASSTDFSGHVIGKEFLNSPHARFTGTRAQVTNTSLYGSYFIVEGGAGGSGCTTCHDVHESVFLPGAEPMKEECTGCHTGAYEKPIANMKHPGGPGTPLVNSGTEPSSPCEICHMPKGMDGTLKAFHIWRINVDPNYSTFTKDGITPGYCSNPVYTTKAACLAAGKSWSTVAASAPEGSFTNAVWIDVDLACGQCHGGSLGTTATKNSAVFYDKAALASLAAGFHDGASANNQPPAAIGAVATTATPLQVQFTDASVDPAANFPQGFNAGAVSINWGDGTAAGVINNLGVTTHTYAAAGTYNIIQTVIDKAGLSASTAYRVVVTQPKFNVTVTLTDVAPLAPLTANAYVYLKTTGGSTVQYCNTKTGCTFSNVSVGTYKVQVYKSGNTFTATAPYSGNPATVAVSADTTVNFNY